MNGTQDPQTDPVQAMLAQASLKTTLFAPNSRYYGIETATITIQGVPTVYLRRRFVPQPASFQTTEQHTVMQSERLDHIAARYFGDPTLFWRIADANNALRAEQLVEVPGRRLRITLPAGIAGAPI